MHEVKEAARTKTRLTVQIAAKLNRSHLVTGDVGYVGSRDCRRLGSSGLRRPGNVCGRAPLAREARAYKHSSARIKMRPLSLHPLALDPQGKQHALFHFRWIDFPVASDVDDYSCHYVSHGARTIRDAERAQRFFISGAQIVDILGTKSRAFQRLADWHIWPRSLLPGQENETLAKKIHSSSSKGEE
jgi:hypothetical protein